MIYAEVETMWTYEHRLECAAAPETLWARFEDVARWPEWNAGIGSVELQGPFATGSTIVMDTLQMRLADVRAPERFVDETALGDVRVRVEHRLEPAPDGGTTIIYRMEITGPDAETLGPEISADFPEVMAALAATG